MTDVRFEAGRVRDTTATITLDGGHDIFRFAVNMLGMQVEFGDAGRTLLVELREHLTPERFDPMARSLLGEDRYGRLKDRFVRDAFCVACEADLVPGEMYARVANAEALCQPCVEGYDPFPLFEVPQGGAR